MAKWGEGDPRWIVEERPDAKNVNNWHWAEKNANAWSINKLTSLLVGTQIESGFAKCVITEVKKCKGEAVAINRKGRIMIFYEWNIELEWTGKLTDRNESVRGRVEIPDFTDEQDISQVKAFVRIDNSGEQKDTLSRDVLLNVMKFSGVLSIRKKLNQYVAALKKDTSDGLILPTKDSDSASKPDLPKAHFQGNGSQVKEKHLAKKSRLEIETTEFQSTETFKCTAEDFYRAMTDPNVMKLVTQGLCFVEAKAMGKFELFDGNVTGHFVELVENQLIAQKWRFSTWPENHWSDVCLKICQKEDCTEVTVTHKGVPKSHLENTRDGWKRFYWDGMKRNLGFGSFLF